MVWRFARQNALALTLGAAALAALAWLGLYGFAWNDYDTEARPAVEALVAGHLGSFFSLSPLYGGSLLERAPFALLPGLWGGGALSTYRLLALPCLLAGLALGLCLLVRMRAAGAPRLARATALGLCVANPLALIALELGHPEELLGGALCVIAVLLAARGRILWAGLALGLAIANKEWAILAAGPVLVAAPARRGACMALAGAVAGALLAPFALASGGSFVAVARGTVAGPSPIFQPWQLWWFLGHHGAVVHGAFGDAKPGYRTAPAWIGMVSHPLVVAQGMALTVPLLWWRRRATSASESAIEGEREGRALLLLALLLLLRCALDTWDTAYYAVPFVLALTAWEGLALRRAPLLALAAVAAMWLDSQWMPAHVSADVQAAFFAAWSLALVALLALRLYGADGRRRDHSTTVSSLERPLSTWQPSPVTMTRSSILTPTLPGR